MKVVNEKPQVLSPLHDVSITGDFDPVAVLRDTIVEPLFTPLIASMPVSFTVNGSVLSKGEIVDRVCLCSGDSFDFVNETFVRELFKKCLVCYDDADTLCAKEVFASQSAMVERLPAPSFNVKYTPNNDIIPSCKGFLAGSCSYDRLFASFAYYLRLKTLGVGVVNELAFDDFKSWLHGEISAIASTLSADVMQLFNQFYNVALCDLNECLLLRSDDADGNDELSFPRVLMKYVMDYAKVHDDVFVVMPFDLGELFVPRSLTFINIEKHSHSNARDIDKAWDIVRQGLSMKLRVISRKRLCKLPSVVRSLHRSGGANANVSDASCAPMSSKRVAFSGKRPSSADLNRNVARVMRNMSNVAKSENSYKCVKMSYARANRRDPDNFNLQGKVVSTRFRPDIHLYLDTSGSISRDDYENAVFSCIRLAKKTNVNLYVNSFSHILSQCTLLRTKDRSLREIYRKFDGMKTVGGGTNFEQIWHYVNASAKRKREMSVVITDFDWRPPSYYVQHPRNLYYYPCLNSDWGSIKTHVEAFYKNMLHIEPNIRKHILF